MKKIYRYFVTVVVFVIVVLLLSGIVSLFINKGTRIVCAGDSLTYGSGVLKTRETDCYPAQLQELLGDDYKVINCGLRNATASFESDLPYVESKEYKKSLDKKADIVFLMLGANDSKTYNWDRDKYKSGLTELVKSYQRLSKSPKVVLMRPPFAFSEDGSEVANYEIQPSIVEKEVGAVVEEVAKECQVEIVDMYTLTEEKRSLYTDGIHFTKDGYSLIANEVYNHIMQ